MSEISDLARDLRRAGPAMAPGFVKAFRSEGKEFRQKWRRTAKRTAGRHGKYYARDITSEVTAEALVVTLDVGPLNRGGKGHQGRMGRGFEFGSRNQRPHLDGARYLRVTDEKIERAATRAVDRHIPGLDR